MILNNETNIIAENFLNEVIKMCLDFKLTKNSITTNTTSITLEPMPTDPHDLNSVLSEFKENILSNCSNFSNSNFMGFPDSGNSIAAMAGAICSELLQQNLINQTFCSPSATYVEINVIRWLREIIGYYNIPAYEVNDTSNIGGIITQGGTISNTLALLLARENHKKHTLSNGVISPSDYKIIIPKDIGHYSIKCSQMWLGCGNNLIEIPTINHKMDLNALRSALREHKGKIMAVVAYAGDSRSMSIDNLEEIYNITKEFDSNIWLHADACHGFSLGLSNELKYKLKGLELYDSVTTDPHKVLFTPYTISALLIKDPTKINLISMSSDLITKDPFDLGKITPFIGSKNWTSLKLWFLIKNFGRNKLGEIIYNRHLLAKTFASKLKNDTDFIVLNDVDINSVMFMYKNDSLSIDKLNEINKKIYSELLKDGEFYLHQFPIPDINGVISKDSILYPLRYMSGNPNLKEENLDNLLAKIKSIISNITCIK